MRAETPDPIEDESDGETILAPHTHLEGRILEEHAATGKSIANAH
jgi:hypothetical protein